MLQVIMQQWFGELLRIEPVLYLSIGTMVQLLSFRFLNLLQIIFTGAQHPYPGEQMGTDFPTVQLQDGSVHLPI